MLFVPPHSNKKEKNTLYYYCLLMYPAKAASVFHISFQIENRPHPRIGLVLIRHE